MPNDDKAGAELDQEEAEQLDQMRNPREGAWGVLSPNIGLMVLPDTREASGQEQAMAISMLPGWSARQLREGHWVQAPMSAAEWVARSGSADQPDIETSVMVLGFFEGVGPGIPPGDFFRSLIDAICRADPGNLYRLRSGFPRLVATVRLYQETEGGRDWLVALVESYRRELAAGKDEEARR